MNKLFAVTAVLMLAVSARAADKVKQMNPYDFGAAGNGIKDDTLAIQRGLDTCGTNKWEFYFAAGTYKVTSALTAPYEAVNIRGTTGTKIIYSGTNKINAILTIGPTIGSYGAVVKDLWLQGNANSTNGLIMNHTFHIDVENIWVGNVPGIGVWFGTNVLGTAKNVRVSLNEYGPVWGTEPAVGIKLQRCNSLTLIDPVVESAGSIGIWLDEVTQECVILGGSAENGLNNTGATGMLGFKITGQSKWNTVEGLACEENQPSAYDGWIEGQSSNNRIVSGYYLQGLYVTNTFNTIVENTTVNNLVIDTGSTSTKTLNVKYNFQGTGAIIDRGSGTEKVGNIDLATAVRDTNIWMTVQSPTLTAKGINGGDAQIALVRTNSAAGNKNYRLLNDNEEYIKLQVLSDDWLLATNLMRWLPNGTTYAGTQVSQNNTPLVLESAAVASGVNLLFKSYGTTTNSRYIRNLNGNLEFINNDYDVTTHRFQNDGQWLFQNKGIIQSADPEVLTLRSTAASGPNITFAETNQPLRYIRAKSGNLEFINDLYTLTTHQFGNDGSMTVAGAASFLADVSISGALYVDTMNVTNLSTSTLTTTNGVIYKFVQDGPSAATIGAYNFALWASNAVAPTAATVWYRRDTTDGIAATDTLIPYPP